MRILLLTFFVPLLWLTPAHAVTLGEVFEAAWSRSTMEMSSKDNLKFLDASIRASSSLTPAAPALIGEYRHELLYGLKRNSVSPSSVSLDGSGTVNPASMSRDTSIDGNELRIGINIPLWLPGQRSNSISASNADKKAYLADYKSSRLDMAGEIRSLVAELRAADIEIKLAMTTAQEGASLVDEVRKRYKAGELAKMDLDKAISDQKNAEADLLRAKQRKRKALLTYGNLTGMSELPSEPEKITQDSQFESHPRRSKFKADLDASMAKEKKVRSEVIDTPEITLTYATFLNSRISPADKAAIVGFKIPLPSSSRYEAKISEAKVERIKAAALAQREEEIVQSAASSSKLELERAQDEREVMQTAFDSAQGVYVATKRAFDLGESDLNTLLKASADKRRAELRFESAKLSVDTAISFYNQSLGVLP